MFIDSSALAWLIIPASGLVVYGVKFTYSAGRRTRNKEFAQLEAIALGDADETLKLWISNAAQASADGPVCRHFQKHVQELFEEVKTPSDREAWSASTHNLLDIYDKVHGIEHSANLRIGRMLLKYQSEPKGHTPPPKVLTPKEEKEREKERVKEVEKERKRVEKANRYSGS